MPGDLKGFEDRARALADRLREADRVKVVAHIDADGITAGSIAYGVLRKMGLIDDGAKESPIVFYRSLGPKEVEEINGMDEDTIWLVDFGSGMLSGIAHEGAVVCDHHQVDRGPGQRTVQRTLSDYCGVDEDRHLNPMSFGFEGSYELSGAGTTYMVGIQLDRSNIEFAHLAIVGAVGDVQDMEHRGLAGPLHARIIDDAERAGTMDVEHQELMLYGRETKPVAYMLTYGLDDKPRGLFSSFSDTARTLEEFFDDWREEHLYGWKERRWGEIPIELRRRALDQIVRELDTPGRGSYDLRPHLGDVYVIKCFEPGMAIREAREYATFLNSLGRHNWDDPEEMLAWLRMNVTRDKDFFRRHQLDIANNHKDEIKRSLDRLDGVVRHGDLVQIIVPKRGGRGGPYDLQVKDTMLGILTNMVLSMKGSDPRYRDMVMDRPLFAMTAVDDDHVKVSGRMKRECLDLGINIGLALKESSAKVGGGGGGHNVAAGATVPSSKVEEFLRDLDEILKYQIGDGPKP